MEDRNRKEKKAKELKELQDALRKIAKEGGLSDKKAIEKFVKKAIKMIRNWSKTRKDKK